MKLSSPQFTEGVQWRKLTAAERNGKPWKYELLHDITVRFSEDICMGRYHLYDGDGNQWGIIKPTEITVRRFYQWNGSSCSPDLKGVLLASVVHDLLYQFSGTYPFPLLRSFCDRVFYDLSTTKLRCLYLLGLTVGGWTCWGKQATGLRITT